MTAHPVPLAMLEEFHVLEVGTTGSGKTYLLRGLLEQLRRADRRVGAIDKLGNHWGLTLATDGKGAGLEFVIFGGRRAHVPMTPADGARLGRLFVERNIPGIFDVSQWKAFEQETFVAEFADAVFEANFGRGPLHLSFDEAQSWAPQGTSAASTASIRRLVEQGRGNGVLAILAVQRLARLDITVRNLCQGVIALRQTGVADRRALVDLMGADIADTKGFDAALPRLKTGEGFVWNPGAATLEQHAFPANATFDSSRTPKHGEVAAAAAPVMSKLVEELRAALAPPATDRSEPADPIEGQVFRGEALIERDSRIAELEDELTKANDRTELLSAQIRRHRRLTCAAYDRLRVLVIDPERPDAPYGSSEMPPGAANLHSEDANSQDLPDAIAPTPGDGEGEAAGDRPTPPSPAAMDATEPLNGIAQAILANLREVAPASLTWQQAAMMAGRSPKSGPFYAAKRQLLASRLVAAEANWVRAAGGGNGVNRRRAIEIWRATLKGFAPRMLDQLSGAGWITRDDLGTRMGVSTKSGPWFGGLKALREPGLIEEDGSLLRLARPLPGQSAA